MSINSSEMYASINTDEEKSETVSYLLRIPGTKYLDSFKLHYFDGGQFKILILNLD